MQTQNFFQVHYQVSVILLFALFFALPKSGLSGKSKNESNKMKILIITGGHDFEREQFFAMFESFKNIKFTTVKHPWANYSFQPGIADSFDVFVFYDMYQEINDSQKEAFLKLLRQGKGMVFLHHSLASYQDWAEFEKIIGGRYYLNDRKIKDKIFPKSTYKHDEEIDVRVVDVNHPVTRGLRNFRIHDEVYGDFTVLPDVKPLLETNHPQSGKTIAWTNSYGKSKIVYIQSGHDHLAYENENYQKLVFQSIEWVAH